MIGSSVEDHHNQGEGRRRAISLALGWSFSKKRTECYCQQVRDTRGQSESRVNSDSDSIKMQ